MAKTLVAYFSTTGTTAKLAARIAKALNADLHEIRSRDPYTIDDGEEESHAFVPAVANRVGNMDQYELVIVAFPAWWGLAISMVRIFLSQYDLQGKTVVPVSPAGGTMVNICQKLEPACAGARLVEGKVFSSIVRKTTIRKWAAEVSDKNVN